MVVQKMVSSSSLIALEDAIMSQSFEATFVPSVFRQQVLALGWPATLVDRWDQIPWDEVSSAGWQVVVYRTGQSLAHLAERETSLDYHNLVHIAETLVSASWLAHLEYPSDIDRREEGLKLLTVMAAHDLDYGKTPWDAPIGTAENAAAAILKRQFLLLCSRAHLMPILEEMVRAVLGTEATLGAQANAAAYVRWPQISSVRLAVLANEADIMASLLPLTGVVRGSRLATECVARGNELASRISTTDGPREFLKSLPLASNAAAIGGLRGLRDQQLSHVEA